MKIIVTGSLGHISKPLATLLVQNGHEVTVISSKPERQKDIETLGATSAIGSLEDVNFIATTFAGADAVYCMVPPNYYFNHDLDPFEYCRTIGNNYAQAIRQSGVKRVVQLSSFGTHLDKGTGFILGARMVEDILKELPDIALTLMRPTSFYYNLYRFIPMIKESGFIAANYGGDDKLVWVAPADIAAAVAEEIETPSTDRKVRYVSSDELTANETAGILGAAIGKPELKWITITNEQMQSGLEMTGMPKHLAAGLVELHASFHSQALAEDYYRNRPAVMGKIKMTDFAEDFASCFHNS